MGENCTKEMMDVAWGKLAHALDDIQKSPIYINDKTSQSINEIRAEARRMVMLPMVRLLRESSIHAQ